jgi:hypothetical protein
MFNFIRLIGSFQFGLLEELFNKWQESKKYFSQPWMRTFCKVIDE